MTTPQSTERRTTEPVVYTARTHTVGGRENGVARSSDGRLDIKLSLPGSPGAGVVQNLQARFPVVAS